MLGHVEEAELLAALKAGDEQAFAGLVDELSPALLSLAKAHLPDRGLAEDVVQETWLAVMQGLPAFEGRSTLKTWVISILLNRARTRAVREGRAMPFSALSPDEGWTAVDPERFLPPDHPEWPGHWLAAPHPWERNPEECLVARESLTQVLAAIEALPEQQRAVIAMRDVHGFGADEVCELLGMSEGNQRVLLHRARSRVRGQLEAYFRVEEA